MYTEINIILHARLAFRNTHTFSFEMHQILEKKYLVYLLVSFSFIPYHAEK